MRRAGTDLKGPTQVGNKNINKTRNCPHSLEFISISGAKSPFYLLKNCTLVTSRQNKSSGLWAPPFQEGAEGVGQEDMRDIHVNLLHTMVETDPSVTRLICPLCGRGIMVPQTKAG